jgi:hypothetical protein
MSKASSHAMMLRGRCSVFGIPGVMADAFTEALMGHGAEASWMEEVDGVDGSKQEVPELEPGEGEGPLWLKAQWHNCKVVALFRADGIQVSGFSFVVHSVRT